MGRWPRSLPWGPTRGFTSPPGSPEAPTYSRLKRLREGESYRVRSSWAGGQSRKEEKGSRQEKDKKEEEQSRTGHARLSSTFFSFPFTLGPRPFHRSLWWAARRRGRPERPPGAPCGGRRAGRVRAAPRAAQP